MPNVLSLLLLLLGFKALFNNNLNEMGRAVARLHPELASAAPRARWRLGRRMAQANNTEGRVEAELPGVA